MGLLGNALGDIAKGIAVDAAGTAIGAAADVAASASNKLKTALETRETKIEKALKKNPQNCKMVVEVDLLLNRKRSGKYTVRPLYSVRDGNGPFALHISESLVPGKEGLVLRDVAEHRIGKITKKKLASLSIFRNVYTVELAGSAPFEVRSLAFGEKKQVNGDSGSRFRALYSFNHNGWQYGHYLSFVRDDEIRDLNGAVVAKVPWFFNSLRRTFVIDYANPDDGLLCAVFALVQCMEFCERRRAEGRSAGSGGGA